MARGERKDKHLEILAPSPIASRLLPLAYFLTGALGFSAEGPTEEKCAIRNQG